jgi:hypothetical protein
VLGIDSDLVIPDKRLVFMKVPLHPGKEKLWRWKDEFIRATRNVGFLFTHRFTTLPLSNIALCGKASLYVMALMHSSGSGTEPVQGSVPRVVKPLPGKNALPDCKGYRLRPDAPM